MADPVIPDLFAGPGGWDEAARALGIDTVGLEWEHDACRTAVAAGHKRIRADVAAYPVHPFDGAPGVIASPPCQAWSSAGRRLGEHDRQACHELADRMAAGDDSTSFTDWADPRSALVCQPIRWARELRPEWVALEEVPAVLGLWEHFARILQAWGYSTYAVVLNAADYGVPQNRRRAVLGASRDHPVAPPPPTHSRSADPGLFGDDLKPVVTMAEALGWGLEEPSATVSGGGGEAGGPEPFANAAYRRRLSEFVAAGITGQGRPRDPRTDPADTITGKGTACWTEPGGWGYTDRPAPTVMAGEGGKQSGVEWGGSTTRKAMHEAAAWREKPGTIRGTSAAIRITVEEAGVLQSFPADYPWTGTLTKRYQQVGNAIPPLLAAHVLRSVIS